MCAFNYLNAIIQQFKVNRRQGNDQRGLQRSARLSNETSGVILIEHITFCAFQINFIKFFYQMKKSSQMTTMVHRVHGGTRPVAVKA